MKILHQWIQAFSLLHAKSVGEICSATLKVVGRQAHFLLTTCWWLALLPLYDSQIASLLKTFGISLKNSDWLIPAQFFFTNVLILITGPLSSRIFWWPVVLPLVDVALTVILGHRCILLTLYAQVLYLFIVFVVNRSAVKGDHMAIVQRRFADDFLPAVLLAALCLGFVGFIAIAWLGSLYGMMGSVAFIIWIRGFMHNPSVLECGTAFFYTCITWYGLALLLFLDDKKQRHQLNLEHFGCVACAARLMVANLPIVLLFIAGAYGVDRVGRALWENPLFVNLFSGTLSGPLCNGGAFVLKYLIGISLLSVLYERMLPAYDKRKD